MATVSPYPTKYCFACGSAIDARAEICPGCGVRQQPSAGAEPPEVEQARRTRLAAGICAILLGSLGIHKFILGATTPGLIMLLATILTFGLGAIPMGLIGLVEGLLYLTKSDREFYETYVERKKGWF